ncbi:MAG: PAS domain-containing protein, partial [Flavobacteriales bacterium]
MATANEHKQTESTGAKRIGEGSEGTWANDLVGFFTTTLAGRLLDCNQVLADMLGYSRPSEMMEMAVGSFY